MNHIPDKINKEAKYFEQNDVYGLQGQNAYLTPRSQEIKYRVNPSSSSPSTNQKIAGSPQKILSSFDKTNKIINQIPILKDVATRENSPASSQIKMANNILLSAFDAVLNGKQIVQYNNEELNKLINAKDDGIVSRNGQSEILKVDSLKSQQKKNQLKENLRRRNKENLVKSDGQNDIKNNFSGQTRIESVQSIRQVMSFLMDLAYCLLFIIQILWNILLI